MKIGFIGLGKLGLPCALAIESRGHTVVGYDPDKRIKKYIKDKKIPYREEGIDKYLDKTKIKVVSLKKVVDSSEIIFVAVQTPHEPKYEGITRLPEERKDFDYSYLLKALNDLDLAAYALKKDVVVAVISTVLPGTMDEKILPMLSRRLKICYNPFFIAMGITIDNFLNPEFVLLGMDDKDSIDKVEMFYRETLNELGQYKMAYKGPEIFKCSIKTAEAIKVFYNTAITTKICMMNSIMEICYHTGADVDDVTKALSIADKRIISSAYMRGGMGDGGSCHPRDCIALSAVVRKYDISYDWWGNLMIAREEQTGFLVNLIAKYWYGKDNFAAIIILGKAFKPETNITTGSPAMLLGDMLSEVIERKYIHGYDPYVDKRSEIIENKSSSRKTDPPCIFFIGTAHEEFKSYVFPKHSAVIDPWRYISPQENVKVISIGRGKDK